MEQPNNLLPIWKENTIVRQNRRLAPMQLVTPIVVAIAVAIETMS